MHRFSRGGIPPKTLFSGSNDTRYFIVEGFRSIAIRIGDQNIAVLH